MAISPDNPWLPQTYGDVAAYMVAPISAPYTFGYAMAYFVYKDSDDPLPAPDWRANVRNYGLWSFKAGMVWAYNSYMHPGKYSFVSGSKAFQLVAKHVPPQSLVPLVLAAPMAIGFKVTESQIEQMPSHEQQPFWRSVAQALTGTGFSAGGADIGL